MGLAMLAQLERSCWYGRHTGQLGLLNTSTETTLAEPTIHKRASWERESLGQLVSARVRLATYRFAAEQAMMWLVDIEDERGMFQVLEGGNGIEPISSIAYPTRTDAHP